MSLLDDLSKLQSMRDSGHLSDGEFALAKNKLLNDSDSQPADVSGELARIRKAQELGNLDREWQIERERYMVYGRYGHREMPGQTLGYVAAIFAVIFGIVWIVMAASMGAPFFFPLFGLVFIGVVIATMVVNSKKSMEYDAAEKRYQEKRANIQRGE